MSGEDVFTAMVIEELNQYKRFFLLRERELLKQGKYMELALHSLRQTSLISIAVILVILIFSLFSIYFFIQFGNHGNWMKFILGIVSWFIVIISTTFYIKDIVEKRRCMQRVLKLMEAREEYIQESS